MVKHQLNRSDHHSTAINTKLRRQLPPAHDDTDYRTVELQNQEEQVADAKALLDITKSLVMSVKGHANGGVTPSEFVSNGPISAKAMQRKAVNRRSRKHVRPNELARPEELGRGPREVKADTDKNILTMFNILRKNNVVKLENLILNRNSFAQTVENL
ncbi:uncharacterized protein DS421_10g303280 [Arachis hypogaea]|nr:uncharacterized protein DS421_10g303280 [Arachis hypogaea]